MAPSPSLPAARASLAGLLSAVLMVTAGGVIAPANPVISSVAPDPTVTRAADGAFHVYATSDDWSDGVGYRLVPHFVSYDLVEWAYQGDAFASRPAWHDPGGFIWAPDVHRLDDGFVMYYTTGEPRTCIGRATAPSPDGPWVDDGAPIVCKGEDPAYPELDPMDPFVVFADDAPVMYMGNFEGMHAVEMNAEGTELVGEAVSVAGLHVEAPTVIQRGEHTHLFLSSGHCCLGTTNEYHVVSGRGDGLFGPFVDRDGVDLTDDGGDRLLSGNSDWVGPGHTDVVTDDAGQDWLIYHAAPARQIALPNGVQFRQMLIDKLDWDEDGWPVVGDGTPSVDRSVDPVVELPVRLDAAGEVAVASAVTAPGSVGSGAAGADDAPILTAPARLTSTGSAFTGTVRATLTGPSKSPVAVRIVDPATGEPATHLPVAVAAGESRDLAIEVEVPEGLPVGRYELVLHIGEEPGVTREIAVFGVALDPHTVEPAPLGSVPLGSVGPFAGSLGSFGS